MAEDFPGLNLSEVTDKTDEFGRPWDQSQHVDPIDAHGQPEPGEGVHGVTPAEFLLLLS